MSSFRVSLKFKFNRVFKGSVAKWLEQPHLRFRGHGFNQVMGLSYGRSKFEPLAMVLNSQQVCLLPLGWGLKLLYV